MHQYPRKRAIRAGDPDVRHHPGVIWVDEDAGGPGENRNQKIKCRTKIKESNILDRFKKNKTFVKRSVKRKEQINKAKYIQKIKDIQNTF